MALAKVTSILYPRRAKERVHNKKSSDSRHANSSHIRRLPVTGNKFVMLPAIDYHV
jgi:hypothetical protein